MRSIRTRLTVTFISLALCPLLVLGVVISWQVYSSQKQQALLYQHERARHISTQVESFIRGIEHDLLLSDNLQSILECDSGQQHDILEGLLSFEKSFEELVLLNSEGQELAGAHYIQIFIPDILGSRSGEDAFLVPKNTGTTYFGPVRFHEESREPYMILSIPQMDLAEGQVRAVLIATVRLKKIWDILAEMRSGRGENIYLLDDEQRVVAHQDPSVVLRNTYFQLPDSYLSITKGLQGQQVVMAVEKQTYGEHDLYVVAEKTTVEAFALASQTMRVTTFVAIFSLAAAVGIIILTVGKIVRPVRELATVAQEITAGNLHRQAEVASKDEVGALALAFNSMTGKLRQTLEGLENEIVSRKKAQDELGHAHDQLKEAHEVLEQRVAERTVELVNANERLKIEIAEREKADEDLRKYAQTQEVLLREVNHRVKNNLAAVISMLYKEIDSAEEKGITEYLDVLNDLLGRIQGLSTVHSLLSASSWRPLSINELCIQVINGVINNVSPGKRVILDVQSSPLKVGSNVAHHLTLVINELAMNSVKHGFAERDTLTIKMKFNEHDGYIRVIFRDNGPGYPEQVIHGDENAFNVGFDLIFGIVRESLRGRVQLHNDQGAIATIEFKQDQNMEWPGG